VGALASGVPAWLMAHANVPLLTGLRVMFLLYAAIGAAIWWLYRRLPRAEGAAARSAMPLGPSRGVVFKLAALFSVDAFAGGLVVNSLLTLWLFERFGLSLGEAGVFFFWSGLLSAFSQLAAPIVAKKIGLLNTMVYTHIPANVFLILAALAPSLPLALGLLFARSALSQMDVPTRTAFVMAAVTPAERAAAASFTAVPRSLASAASPTLAGALLAAGLLSVPLVACGALKIAYDRRDADLLSPHALPRTQKTSGRENPGRRLRPELSWLSARLAVAVDRNRRLPAAKLSCTRCSDAAEVVVTSQNAGRALPGTLSHRCTSCGRLPAPPRPALAPIAAPATAPPAVATSLPRPLPT
jgi:hypothetical protein